MHGMGKKVERPVLGPAASDRDGPVHRLIEPFPTHLASNAATRDQTSRCPTDSLPGERTRPDRSGPCRRPDRSARAVRRALAPGLSARLSVDRGRRSGSRVHAGHVRARLQSAGPLSRGLGALHLAPPHHRHGRGECDAQGEAVQGTGDGPRGRPPDQARTVRESTPCSASDCTARSMICRRSTAPQSSCTTSKAIRTPRSLKSSAWPKEPARAGCRRHARNSAPCSSDLAPGVGIMNEDRFDELMRDAAQYVSQTARSPISTGCGRRSKRDTSERGTVATTQPARSRSADDSARAHRAGHRRHARHRHRHRARCSIDDRSTTPRRATQTVAAVGSVAPRARRTRRVDAPYDVETSQYLGQTAALLIALPSEVRGGTRRRHSSSARAGELLTPHAVAARFAGRERSRRCATCSRISSSCSRRSSGFRTTVDSRTELDLINRALEQRDVIPRLRTAVADISAN